MPPPTCAPVLSSLSVAASTRRRATRDANAAGRARPSSRPRSPSRDGYQPRPATCRAPGARGPLCRHQVSASAFRNVDDEARQQFFFQVQTDVSADEDERENAAPPHSARRADEHPRGLGFPYRARVARSVSRARRSPIKLLRARYSQDQRPLEGFEERSSSSRIARHPWREEGGTALGHVMPLARAHARSPARGCAARRARGRPRAPLDADGARPTAPSEGDDAPADITKDELIRTSTAVRLSSHGTRRATSNRGSPRTDSSFAPRASPRARAGSSATSSSPRLPGTTRKNLRRASRRASHQPSHQPPPPPPPPPPLARHAAMGDRRGAAWNDELVDRVKLSTQIACAWPAPSIPASPSFATRASPR